MSDTRVVKAGIRIDLEPVPRWVGMADCPRCKATVEIGEDWGEHVYPNDLERYEKAMDAGINPINTLFITCPACGSHSIQAVGIRQQGTAYERAERRRKARLRRTPLQMFRSTDFSREPAPMLMILMMLMPVSLWCTLIFLILFHHK